MWYIHVSLFFDLVACCIDWQCPQFGRWVFISAYYNFILVYDVAMCFCESRLAEYPYTN